jgi:hypothetical protein
MFVLLPLNEKSLQLRFKFLDHVALHVFFHDKFQSDNAGIKWLYNHTWRRKY